MDQSAETEEFLADMQAKRGYVLPYHRLLATNDLPFLRAADALIEAAYLDDRLLDRRTKELIFITTLTVMRGDQHHIESHIRVALREGATPQEVLEALEIILPEAGVVAFQAGLRAWEAVVGASDGQVQGGERE